MLHGSTVRQFAAHVIDKIPLCTVLAFVLLVFGFVLACVCQSVRAKDRKLTEILSRIFKCVSDSQIRSGYIY